MDKREMIYWGLTALFCAAFTMGGTAHLLRLDPIPANMAALGYPAYLMTILGTAKLLGVLALVVPGRPLLKEWAYAGFAFDLTGAVASHMLAGEPVAASLPPALLLALGAASYLMRPESRRLVSAPSL
jgi:hypothetical protein